MQVYSTKHSSRHWGGSCWQSTKLEVRKTTTRLTRTPIYNLTKTSQEINVLPPPLFRLSLSFSLPGCLFCICSLSLNLFYSTLSLSLSLSLSTSFTLSLSPSSSSWSFFSVSVSYFIFVTLPLFVFSFIIYISINLIIYSYHLFVYFDCALKPLDSWMDCFFG